MFRYIMIPIWWVYAEIYFIKYRIRTDILRKPDRTMKLTTIDVIITEEMLRNNKFPDSADPVEYNLDEMKRNLRNEFKKGIFRESCHLFDI